MQVNENRLDTILQDFVETFNDCACCPLTFDCERDDARIDCYECAEMLKTRHADREGRGNEHHGPLSR